MEDYKVRVTKGVFKGIEGTIEKFVGLGSGRTKVHINVDSQNTIILDSEDIEFTEEEYLIYVTHINSGELSKIITPYITRMAKSNLESYIQSVSNEINPERIENIYGYYKYDNIKYRVTATPVKDVNTHFKINGLDIDTISLANIIDKLK